MSWPRDMTDYTLFPNLSSFEVLDVLDVTSNEALATDNDYYY